MWIFIGLSWFIAVVFIWALVAFPKSEEEQRAEDEAQIKYLKEYMKKKKK